eukprot:TRINITY_DN1649_c0_g1_i7.p1 TRINITY_DN1649_c0_g1~~TRINITY_DN1649_c0_g1_i7.p1  ORF type:complete len:426 (+),score=54.61 TRINITY_DN1649_c0_g1_i7:85-1362(+)
MALYGHIQAQLVLLPRRMRHPKTQYFCKHTHNGQQLRECEQVELVGEYKDGFLGAYFSCKILKKSIKRLQLELIEFFEEDGAPCTEYISLPTSRESLQDYKISQQVDIKVDGVWWQGVVMPATNPRKKCISVILPYYSGADAGPYEISDSSNIRVSKEWNPITNTWTLQLDKHENLTWTSFIEWQKNMQSIQQNESKAKTREDNKYPYRLKSKKKTTSVLVRNKCGGVRKPQHKSVQVDIAAVEHVFQDVEAIQQFQYNLQDLSPQLLNSQETSDICGSISANYVEDLMQFIPKNEKNNSNSPSQQNVCIQGKRGAISDLDVCMQDNNDLQELNCPEDIHGFVNYVEDLMQFIPKNEKNNSNSPSQQNVCIQGKRGAISDLDVCMQDNNDLQELNCPEDIHGFEQWPDFGCEGIKVQRAHQPTSQ